MTVQASLGLRSSLWSYNPLLTAWEPIIEPWDVILKLDSNRSHEVRRCRCICQPRLGCQCTVFDLS